MPSTIRPPERQVLDELHRSTILLSRDTVLSGSIQRQHSIKSWPSEWPQYPMSLRCTHQELVSRTLLRKQMPGEPEILIRLHKAVVTAGDSLDGDVLVHLPDSIGDNGTGLWSRLMNLKAKSSGPPAATVPTNEFSDDSDEDFDDFEDHEGDLDDSVTLVDGATRLAGVDSQPVDAQHWSSRVVGVQLDFLGKETTLAVCQHLGFEPEHKCGPATLAPRSCSRY